MREDLLHEEIKQFRQSQINIFKNFFKSNKGMWQGKNNKEYPPDEGFMKAGILFAGFGVLFWGITEILLLISRITVIDFLGIRTFLYFSILFFCISVLFSILDIYIYNRYKTKIFKPIAITLFILFFLPIAPFLILIYLLTLLFNIIGITFDIFTNSLYILGMDMVIIFVVTLIFSVFENFIIFILDKFIKFILWPEYLNINYSALILFILFFIISFLISFFSRIFDYWFRKNNDEESRRKILRLIYLYKLLLLTYVFIICIFTYSLGEEFGKDVLNVVTFFTVLILLKDKLTALFISKNKPQEFKVQIEWNNEGNDTPDSEETLAEIEEQTEENDEEIVEEEEPSEQEEIKETFVEAPQFFYDSSTIKQPSYRYIRTHKLPNNKKIYRIRKERTGKIFLPK